MIQLGLCKECFRNSHDKTASDKFMLLGKDVERCTNCNNVTHLVVDFFKFGEHSVTDDGLHIVGSARYVGLNPNYSCWSNQSPFK